MFFRFIFIILMTLPLRLNASFIESSIGTAVVEDATATYFNPSAITVLKKKQWVGLGVIARSHSVFTGQITQRQTNFTQLGTSPIQSNFMLPSLYYAMPLASNWFLGTAVIVNDFARDVDGFSLLRYAQSNNRIQGIDFVPALAYKFNQKVSIGAAGYLTKADFLFEPIAGFPALDIPDMKGENDSSGDALGFDVGLLLKPVKTTTLGFNYRSAMTFPMQGQSAIGQFVSPNYHFHYWIPARSVASISHLIKNTKFGLIGTVQYIEWSIFKELDIFNLATPLGILPYVNVPQHFHNSWLFTAGGNYRISKKWVIRAAGSYVQTPSEGMFQIDNGDAITAGITMAYAVRDTLILNFGYSHLFILSHEIDAVTVQNIIHGRTKGGLDAFALKLTLNV